MNKRSKASTDERRVKVDALRAKLDAFEAGLDAAQVALVTSMWSGYSARNALLIAMQCPTATDVAGFVAWRERGRTVRKGEAGIAILAPAGHGDDEVNDAGEVTKSGRQYFRLVHVFDVAQTDVLPVRVAA